MTIAPTIRQPSPPSRGASMRSYLQGLVSGSAYIFASFPASLLAFVVVVTGVSAGASMLVIGVGLPILLVTAYLARGFATAERHAISVVTGRPAPQAVYAAGPPGYVRHADPSASWLRRALTPLRDPQTWSDVIWCVFHLLVTTVTFSIALTWWLGALSMLAGVVLPFILTDALGPEGYQGVSWLFGVSSPWADAIINLTVGIAFAVTLPVVIRGLVSLQTRVSTSLLGSRDALEVRVRELSESRDAGRRAEAGQLRRLERDIHDGPQQRLVRLNMDLARAQRLTRDDPERAQSVLADALAQGQDALAELRRLSRGIAPPLLVDRGLEVAITETAGRSVVPVTVRVDAPRLPDHVETTAYYVASEALANANKHSGATHIELDAVVRTEPGGRRLVLTVTDDGRGGAHVAKGHGLAGLTERLRGVDGTLEVTSPAGGPTVIRAAIPTDPTS